jgi:hypothetical protein
MHSEALKGRAHEKKMQIDCGDIVSLLLPVLHIRTIIIHRWAPRLYMDHGKALKGRAHEKICQWTDDILISSVA